MSTGSKHLAIVNQNILESQNFIVIGTINHNLGL